MRHALHSRGFDAGIGEDDFLVADRGRVAFVGGGHIGLQGGSHGRQLREKFVRDARSRPGQIFRVAVLTGPVHEALVQLVQ